MAIEMMPEAIPALHSELLMEEYVIPVCTPEYLAKRSPRLPAMLRR